jgi:hypothetical protein
VFRDEEDSKGQKMRLIAGEELYASYSLLFYKTLRLGSEYTD